jgi:hypothetical protein
MSRHHWNEIKIIFKKEITNGSFDLKETTEVKDIVVEKAEKEVIIGQGLLFTIW